MTKIRKFTQFSLRDLLATSAPMLALVAVLCYLAYLLVDPTPPRTVTLSTGQFNSAYEEFARKYAAELARDGIKVTLRPSLGSAENLQRLLDGKTDIAFVQSGSATGNEKAKEQLISIGSLFTEPVWLFLRDSAKVDQLTDLRGLKINLGPEGTGVPKLFREILDSNGVEPGQLTIGALENTPATVELLEGRIDGLVFSSAPESPLIQMLLQTPGIRLFNFSQAEAYTRRLPHLTHVLLPRGIVDLGRDLPAQDYHLIAPTATLVARRDLHPALVQLFVQAASGIHGGTGWFQRQGEFPSEKFTEIPVARAASKFYKDGPPFLQRYMSFWLANLLDRMWVVVVALAALWIPLSRVLPPLYVWRVRSRVFRWYGQLRKVEQQLDAAGPDADRAELARILLQRLDQIEEGANRVSLPLAFADVLYGLRSHINLVRQRIRATVLRKEHAVPASEGLPAEPKAVPDAP
ncbi:TAXI family TRAP transporter solute-binding subunit [Pseudoduganella sp. GCM10020061]|uniref:TAXI family TRAP transporter solute-binding subunit n=1 Tax=Pseudoduganella sp. GCM10020061 TaxID=3317345 RepID=UPI00362C9913